MPCFSRFAVAFLPIAGLVLSSGPAQATAAQFTPVAVTATQSVNVRDNTGNTGSQTTTGLGTASGSAADVMGSATTAGGGGSARALIQQGQSGGGLGGGPIGLGGGNGSGNASARLTYEYIFTARKPGEVQQIVAGHMASTSPPVGCAYSPSYPPCKLPTPDPTTYFFGHGTTITGSYQIDSGGYAYGSVGAYGYGPDSLTRFTAECGSSRHEDPACDGFSEAGTFKIDGILAVNAASLAANAFYGFIDLSAGGTLLEGGRASAFIDPRVAFDLPGVDPADFDLSFSPGFSATAAVPEPTTWAMMLLGLAMLGGAVRRRMTLLHRRATA